MAESEKLSKSYKRSDVKAFAFKKSEIVKEKMEMDAILSYQNSVLRLKNNNKSDTKPMEK